MRRHGIVVSLCGFVLWLLLLLYSKAGDIYNLLFLFAPLVVVPLGLALILPWLQDPLSARIHQAASFLQPLCAVAAVISFYLGTGVVAGTLASGWLLLTCLCGLCGISLFVQAKRRSLRALCVIAGLLYLPVGGAWLVSSRLGITPLGFQEPIILLTAIHFHYTGFAAPLLAALAGQFFSENSHTTRKIFPLVALGIISGTPLLAIGFITFPLLKLLAAIVLTCSLSALAVILFLNLRWTSSAVAAILFAISGGSIVAGLFLALVYAWGEYRGELLIGISEMAWTHGLLNGFGFVFCGLLGWMLERR